MLTNAWESITLLALLQQAETEGCIVCWGQLVALADHLLRQIKKVEIYFLIKRISKGKGHS